MLLLFALLSVCAFAQDSSPFEACKHDRETLCAAASNRMELYRCMHEHWAHLSQTCQASIRQFAQIHNERVHAACDKDINTFCSEAKGNFEQLRQCMHTNLEQLSSECKDVLSQHHSIPHHDGGHHQQETETETETQPAKKPCPMRNCANDVHTLCASADSREAVHDCLKTNWARLSEDCRTAIEQIIKEHNIHHADSTSQYEESAEDKVGGSEGMAFRENHSGGKTLLGNEGMASRENGIDGEPIIGQHGMDRVEVHTAPAPTSWKYWLVRLWWTYPVGLVLLIQLLACVRIRQIRKQEAAL